MFPYIKVFSFAIPTFPIILLGAFFICLMLIIKSSKFDIIFYKCIMKAIPWAVISAVILGKGTYAFTKIRQGCSNAYELVDGFVFMGGYYGALLGLFLYSKAFHFHYYDLTDVFSSILPLGQAIGRLGCFCNGCCYGKPWSGVLSIKYPINGVETSIVPTWFIESLFCAFLFLFLYQTPKRKNKGYYTYMYMILYSIFRFLLEYFRGDDIRGYIGVFSTSQFFCLITIIMGIFVYFQSQKNGLSLIILERKKTNANE